MSAGDKREQLELMVEVLKIAARLDQGQHADKIYVAKEYTIADTIRDLRSLVPGALDDPARAAAILEHRLAGEMPDGWRFRLEPQKGSSVPLGIVAKI